MRSLGWVCVLVAGSCLLPSRLVSQESSSARPTPDEKTILALTNAVRKEQNLPPLIVNDRLTKAAREHSQNMAKQKKLAHDLDGKSPFDRIKATEYRFRAAGENVAYGTILISIPEIFDGWMKSDGHRANILSEDFSEIGIGVATNGDQRYYTQVFAKRR